jgi:hypothetical protein
MYLDNPAHLYDEHNRQCWYVWFNKRMLIVLFSAVLVTWSCNQGNAIQQEGLYGKWDIHKAMRNGSETHYLRGGYFIIQPDGAMTINITGTEEKGRFKLDDHTLRLDNKKDFIVESFRQDSMAIRYIMNADNTFLFYLTRNMDEIQ